MNFKLYRYTLSYELPFTERKGLLLNLFDKNKQGWGEIAPLPGRSRETLSQALEQLLSILKGKPCDALFPSVAFGLFSAHNPPAQKPLPLSALLVGTSEQIITKAYTALRQGYTSAKLKISGMAIASAAELIQHLHPLFSLRVDANRAFSFKDAIWLCDQCGAHNLDYIEEPTFDLGQLEHFPYPFALDESLLEMKQLPHNPHFKAIVWKPTVMTLEDLPYSEGKHVVLSSACETGVGILGIASLASLIDPITPLGLDTYRFLSQDILASPLDFSSGNFLAPYRIQVNTHLMEEIAHG